MEGLEERVKRLRERREMLRTKDKLLPDEDDGEQVRPETHVNGEAGGESEEEEDEEDSDDWKFGGS